MHHGFVGEHNWFTAKRLRAGELLFWTDRGSDGKIMMSIWAGVFGICNGGLGMPSLGYQQVVHNAENAHKGKFADYSKANIVQKKEFCIV